MNSIGRGTKTRDRLISENVIKEDRMIRSYDNYFKIIFMVRVGKDNERQRRSEAIQEKIIAPVIIVSR
jgi:hypothetical protein